MKRKFITKKIALIILAILICIVGGFLISILVYNSNKDKYQERYSKVEKNIKDYLYGFSAFDNYKVFEDDKTIISKLDSQYLLIYAINTLETNDELVDEELLNKYSDLTENEDFVTVVDANKITDVLKKDLNVDFKNKTVNGYDGIFVNFEYDDKNNVYIIKYTDGAKEFFENEESGSLDITPISSISRKNSIETTTLVSYIKYNLDDGVVEYYNDEDCKNLVFTTKFDDLEENEYKGHEDEFTKLIVTSTKNGDDFYFSKITKK